MRNYAIYLIASITLIVSGCLENAGIQGGDLANAFNGLDSLVAISPNTVQLAWTLEKRYVSYRVYKTGLNNPVKEETFSSTTIGGLNAYTDYGFSVTGVDSGGKEKGLNSELRVKTLPNFQPIVSQNLEVKSSTRIDLNWTSASSVITFQVYRRLSTQTWGDLTAYVPVEVTGDNKYSATGLTQGLTYCFFVRAKYKDGLLEPTVTDLPTQLASAPCAVTQSTLTPIPRISVDSIFPGIYPWFEVTGGADAYKIEIYDDATNVRVAARSGNGPIRATEVSNPGVKSFTAVVTDLSKTPTIQARFAVKTYDNAPTTQARSLQSSGAQGPLSPRLISQGLGVQNLGSKVVMGDFNCDGLMDVAISAPNATPYIGSSFTSQVGSVVVYYQRFIPAGSAEGNTSPIYRLQTKQVNPLKDSNGIPINDGPSITAVYPDPLLIYYPTSIEGYHFGAQLAVGNFNGDCQRIGDDSTYPTISGDCYAVYKDTKDNAYTSGFQTINSCDDLAIATDTGVGNSVFVTYGNARYGLVAGSGGQNYGLNEQTCDPFFGTCRAVKLSPVDSDATVTTSSFGRALASGDYDNDGYDDLVVSSRQKVTATGLTWSKVYVLRGSNRGIYPLAFSSVGGVVTSNGTPGIRADAVYANATAPLSPGLDSETDFGLAVGTAYNSRACATALNKAGTSLGVAAVPANPGALSSYGSGTSTLNSFQRDDYVFTLAGPGYDLSKCDDLVIGDPSRRGNKGSITVCRGGNWSISPTAWDCREYSPDSGSFESTADTPRYGASILGVRNQNGNPIQAPALAISTPNLVGALFVGAPNATVNGNANAGMVFGYYMTPYKPVTDTTSQDNSYYRFDRGIRGVLEDQASVTDTNGSVTSNNSIKLVHGAVNSIACNRPNNGPAASDSPGLGNRCQHQLISSSAPQAGAQFGYSLGSIQDSDKIRSVPALAIGAPFQSVNSSTGGRTIASSGAAFVYRGDLSSLKTEKVCGGASIVYLPVALPQIKADCETGTTVSYFSGGVSPYGPSLVYPSDLSTGANFSIGGVVGSQFNGIGPSDLVATAPGNSRLYSLTPAAGATPSPAITVTDNGSLFMFAGSGAGFNSTETIPSFEVNDNFSKELKYRFDTAKVVGDVDQDGYDDIVTHSLVGTTRVELVLYYGGPNGIYYPTDMPSATATNHHPLLISSGTDTGLGRHFFRIGSVNNDGFADILVTGNAGSYVFYGSATGLQVSPEPTVSPVGKGPLTFSRHPTSSAGSCNGSYGDYAVIHCQLWGTTAFSTDPTRPGIDYAYDEAVSHGDFNGDGIDDFAVGINSSKPTIPGESTSPSLDYTGTGRVIIFYGSSRGPQTGANPGYTRLMNTTLNAKADALTSIPCTTDTTVVPSKSVCKVQYLSSRLPPFSAGAGMFGWATEGVPDLDRAGSARIYAGLLASDPASQRVYYYKGDVRGLNPVPVQRMEPELVGSGNFFGLQISMAGDINKDGVLTYSGNPLHDGQPDLIISAPSYILGQEASATGLQGVYVFYSGSNGKFCNTDPCTPAAGSPINVRSTTSTPVVQRLLSPTFTTATGNYGFGIAGIGDFNGDGYADVMVNSPVGDYTDNVTIVGTGYVTIYFGSPTGLRAEMDSSTTPLCFGGAVEQPYPTYTSGVCQPYRIYLPNSIESENTYISKSNIGYINSGSVPDILIGGTRRNHSSGSAFATGIVYVLY